MRKGAQNNVGASFDGAAQKLWCSAYICMVHTLVHCKINHPALLCKALLCNIGEYFVGNLLPSLTAMVINVFGVFYNLGKCL